jgi:hypothetical protein
MHHNVPNPASHKVCYYSEVHATVEGVKQIERCHSNVQKIIFDLQLSEILMQNFAL